MAEWCAHYGVSIWAYCLMPNHVHLIAVPETAAALGLAIGEAHRRYTRRVNFREGWRGHLWQGRFAPFPMDARRLLAAARYVERNPLWAGITRLPEDYGWGAPGAHPPPTHTRPSTPRPGPAGKRLACRLPCSWPPSPLTANTPIT